MDGCSKAYPEWKYVGIYNSGKGGTGGRAKKTTEEGAKQKYSNKESEKGHNTQESGTANGMVQETVWKDGRRPGTGAVDIADGTNQTNESVYLPSKMCLPYAYAIMLYIPILPLP